MNEPLHHNDDSIKAQWIRVARSLNWVVMGWVIGAVAFAPMWVPKFANWLRACS